jgi:hypothetical protein
MTLAPPALLMRPIEASVKLEAGLLNLAWLKKLQASKRVCPSEGFPNAEFLESREIHIPLPGLTQSTTARVPKSADCVRNKSFWN